MIDIKQIKPVIHAGTQVIGKYIYISYHESLFGYFNWTLLEVN